MADNPETRPAQQSGKEITIKDATHAPVIYFDGVPTLGINNGIVHLMLAVGIILPTSEGGTQAESVAVAHLRCNVLAAKQLRDSIDKVPARRADDGRQGELAATSAQSSPQCVTGSSSSSAPAAIAISSASLSSSMFLRCRLASIVCAGLP